MKRSKDSQSSSKKSNLKLFFQSFIIALLVGVMSAYGQQTTGNVRGVVKDPAGAIVAGAQVTITNPLTNIRGLRKPQRVVSINLAT